MTLIFISNYINHHQIPFCNAMYQYLKEDFLFMQTEPMDEERIKMGWEEVTELPYLAFYNQNPEHYQALIDDCQVVFFGGTENESYIQNRLLKKAPIIRYSERLYKEGQWKAISPRGLRKKYKDHTKYRKDAIYMLCAGAYVASDFHIVKAYPNKLLKWGYFPEVKYYEDKELLMKNKEAGSIVWAARFIDWKHPEIVIEVAKHLREKGLPFHIDMIGDGELFQTIAQLIQENALEKEITLCGYQTPKQVRSYMEKADIYLMTSDRKEGWGAVVNEAMNSGCTVIGNHLVGAVPFLIDHGRTGLIYQDKKVEQLCVLTEDTLKNRKRCQQMGKNAIELIETVWNAENAAKNLLNLCIQNGFINREQVLFDSEAQEQKELIQGPCSRAPIYAERERIKKIEATIN